MFNPIYHLLSPSGARGKLFTFIFHRVLPHPDPIIPDEPDAVRFRQICRFLKNNFNVLPLSEAVTLLKENRLPSAAACITFDDGYRDNLAVAAPILKEFGLTATFFIATGFTNGGRMWNDSVIEAMRIRSEGTFDLSNFGLGVHSLSDTASRVQAYENVLKQLKYFAFDERVATANAIARDAGLPESVKLMMDIDELRQLEQVGMEIGAHTVRHPILASLGEAEARDEIETSRDQITEWLGRPPSLFAYPNGVPQRDFSERDSELVRSSGFIAAVSTEKGYANSSSNFFRLPRFTPWDRNLFKFALRCGAVLSESSPSAPSK